MQTRKLFLASYLFFVLGSTMAQAQIVWDEGSNGDLSGDRLNPTNINLAMGVNGLIVTTVSGDLDYFHVHLGQGMQVDQLNLVSWSGIDQRGFMALQEGSVFTEPPVGTDVSKLLGYSHIGPGAGNLGMDLLPFLAAGPGSMGFTPPLKGSDYSFWLNQTGGNAVTYRMDFVVTPEPCSILALTGIVMAVARRRKK